MLEVLAVYPGLKEECFQNLGVNLVNYLFNKQSDVRSEVMYMPELKKQKMIFSSKKYLYSRKFQKYVKNIDCIAFSINTEANYINVPGFLHLSDIAPYAQDRNDNTPLILAGGYAMCNPFPLIRFFDFVCIGEAEELIPNLSKYLVLYKRHEINKAELFTLLSKLDGIFVPNINKNARRVWALKPTFFNFYLKSKYDNKTLLQFEISRGCMHNCLFCQPSHTTNPYRQSTLTNEELETLIRQTQRSRSIIRTVALSALDNPIVENLVSNKSFCQHEMDFISVRADQLTQKVARRLNGPNINFGIETGNEDIRFKLKKQVSNEAIINSCLLIERYSPKVKQIRLYYIIGLPGQPDNDCEEMIRLAKTIRNICPSKEIRLAPSIFIPEPHTPFQNFQQISVIEYLDKFNHLKKTLKRNSIEVKSRSIEIYQIETMLTRGGEELAPIIEKVWKLCIANFNNTNLSDFQIWSSALESEKIDLNNYCNSINDERQVSWGKIQI